MLHGLFACHDHLEHPQDATSQGILIIVLRVNLLQSLEGLDCVVEMSHLVGVIAYELEEVVGVGRGFG